MSPDGQDVGGWSALHEAAYADQRDIISLLLVFGANINIQNTDGATPLFTAAQYGHQSCLNLLLEKGADVHMVTTDKAAPLYIAAQEGFVDCMKALLDAGMCLQYLRNFIIFNSSGTFLLSFSMSDMQEYYYSLK